MGIRLNGRDSWVGGLRDFVWCGVKYSVGRFMGRFNVLIGLGRERWMGDRDWMLLV